MYFLDLYPEPERIQPNEYSPLLTHEPEQWLQFCDPVSDVGVPDGQFTTVLFRVLYLLEPLHPPQPPQPPQGDM